MKPARIRLHVEKLMLEGFVPGSGESIKAAVEGELARLLGERGLPASYTSGDGAGRLRGSDAAIGRGAGTEAVGRQLARSIFDGLTHHATQGGQEWIPRD